MNQNTQINQNTQMNRTTPQGPAPKRSPGRSQDCRPGRSQDCRPGRTPSALGVLAALAAILALAALTSACQVDQLSMAKVNLKAATVSAAGRAVQPGTVVGTVSSYRVVFKKIEIGNSETDKYTLWQDAAGVTKDISTAVSFDNVLPVKAGTYQFVRLTIGDSLAVAGSVTDAGTVYSGSGTATLTETVFLWGTSLLNAAGQTTLAAPVTIRDGAVLSFNFDIGGTVTYQGGPASAAVFGVAKPVLGLVAQ